MGTFVAPAFSDHPAVFDRTARLDRAPDAQHSTEPAQYRRPGQVPSARPLVPRQRVVYVQPGSGEEQSKAGVPGDGPDRYPVTHRWPESRPKLYETDWSPPRRRKGRRRARRPGRTMSILIAMSAVSAAAGGVVAVSGANRSTAVPVAIDAALQHRSSGPQAASRGGVRVSPAPVAPSAVSTPSSKAARLPGSSRAPRPPRPLAGLNQAQMNNAAVIVQVAQKRGLPRRAMLVACSRSLAAPELR